MMAMQDPGRDFGLTDEQRMMRDSVQALLARVLPRERIRALDEAGEFPFDAYAALARDGWLGLPFPTAIGGAGGSFKDLAVFVEAVSWHSAQMASAWLTTAIYGGRQLLGASEALKAEIMPGLLRGETRLAFCLTEPHTGSDAAAIRTRAVQDGEDFVITGQKIYITCAHVAHHLAVVTKTEADAGHRGITVFLVDARSPGLTIRPLRALGRRMIHVNEVFFDDVRVPAARMLGGRGQGWSNLMRGLNVERLCLAAAASGNCQRIIDDARDYALERTAFGRRITEFQAVAHKFADMRMMAEAARALTYRAAEMMDAGLDPVSETTIAKVVATENNSRCADMGIQIMGGAGYMMDHDMQMYFRDARVGTIGGGTSEIMRGIIARRMGL
ncbi:Acyl-CoA dehydrogenase [Belnapia rosea]|uniref:Acyl-CoA dehydrogenase n=3 Tax=Belnapia rosea TaxID=938405 RepID=A0A1G7CVK4_9PROT|nr:Acyl-CoA dehydrogenase [Belnapia rosea]